MEEEAAIAELVNAEEGVHQEIVSPIVTHTSVPLATLPVTDATKPAPSYVRITTPMIGITFYPLVAIAFHAYDRYCLPFLCKALPSIPIEGITFHSYDRRWCDLLRDKFLFVNFESCDRYYHYHDIKILFWHQ